MLIVFFSWSGCELGGHSMFVCLGCFSVSVSVFYTARDCFRFSLFTVRLLFCIECSVYVFNKQPWTLTTPHFGPPLLQGKKTLTDPRSAKEWMRDPFVNGPGEASVQEDQHLEVANDSVLKSMFEIATKHSKR